MQKEFNSDKNIDNFIFEIIEEVNGNKMELFRKEQYYIDKYDAFNSGYNCCRYSLNPKYVGNKTANIHIKMTNTTRFIKIPREIIYSKDLGEKRVIIFSYLCSRRALDDTVAFSISELCHWSHLKPNYHDGKINQKYLDTLNLLSQRNYFKQYPDFSDISRGKKNSNNYYNISLNTMKFDSPDSFGMIYFDELGKILNLKKEIENISIGTSRISSACILLLLSYLRVNMNYHHGKPQCCYRLIQTISEDIGLSERYITRIIDILDSMNIVKYQSGKRSRYEKETGEYGFLTAPKVFADYKKYVKDENGNSVIDVTYDYRTEINKQLSILSS